MKHCSRSLLIHQRGVGRSDNKQKDEDLLDTFNVTLELVRKKEGHKLDAITKYDKVSYCVMDKGYRKEGELALNIRSVIVFGRIYEVTDVEKKKEILSFLCKCAILLHRCIRIHR